MSAPAPASWYEAWPVEAFRTADRGRGLRATRNLQAGELVVRTTSYACAVADTWYRRVCQWCFDGGEGSNRPVSCEECGEVSYCSEECRARDLPQHRLECTGLRSFLRDRRWGDEPARTELRLLFRVLGRRALECRGEFVPTAHRFSDFELLIGHQDRMDRDVMANWKLHAAQLRSVSTGLENLEVDAIVATILRLRLNRFSLLSTSGTSLAEGIFLEAALFNHSCQGNIVCERFLGEPTIDFCASREISTGEELTICYIRDSGPELHEQLRTHYYFDCQCERCDKA